MGLLYRALTSDLALAQRDFPNQQVTRYLNQLVGRAHTLIYRGEPLRRRQLTHFYRRGFPQLYRAILPYTIAAFVLFLVPALAAFGAVAVSPEWIYIIEGPGIADVNLAMRDGYTSGQGLGMGLPGTKRLMDDLDIDSAPGRLTTLTIRKWRR